MLGIRCCNYLYKTSSLLTFASLDENFLNQKKLKKFSKMKELEDTIDSIKISDDNKVV
jgi:hypothetical protein